MEIYIVKSGDTVDSVALENEVSVESVLYNNQIEYPYALAVGQALLLTKGTPSNERKTVSVNGYAYPFIDSYVLNQTLPYLSASYGFSAEGELVYPPLDDTFMIEAAIQFQAAPILTLTPFGPDGQFSNYLISRVVNNWEASENLIQQITETVQAKGFQGVDVDFEYILPEDRVPFAEFVGRLREAINAIGYPVSVALAPKTSDTQAGLLYAGKDYALLGEAADSVLLMTYEWGYTYGPPMAVAPINKVREVVEYAITRIPEYKIDLGIPNYGYDWTLPFVKGESKARTIGNIEAIEIQ